MKLFLLGALLLLAGCSMETAQMQGPYIVSNVVDGDTADVSFGRLRFSGINTPEVGECYYEEAKTKVKELILNKEVYLESDDTDKDKYGRYLRYIYVNGTFVNAELVLEGYARVFDKYNTTTKYYADLKVLEKKAQEQKIGIWACPEEEHCLYVASKNSKVYHSPDCKWAKRISAENRICIHSEEELQGYTKSKSC